MATPIDTSRLSATPKIELRRDDVALATLPGIFVLNWLGTPTLESVRAVHESQNRALASQPGKVMLLTIIDGTLALPSSEVRDLMNSFVKSIDQRLGAVAVAIVAGGFGAAAMRALLSGMYLLGRPSYSVKVYSDMQSAAAFLVENWVAASPRLSARAIVELGESLHAP